MKFFLFAFLAIASVLSTGATLQDDFNDIGKLIPIPKVQAIIAQHMFADREFQDFIKFVKSDEFASGWDTLMVSKEFQDVVTYVQGSGYDMVEGLNKLAKLLKLTPYPKFINDDDLIIMPRTVHSFLKNVLKALPRQEIAALMKEKMSTSPHWNKFITHLSQEKFKKLINTALSADSTAQLRNALAKKGLRVDKVVTTALETLLTWVQ